LVKSEGGDRKIMTPKERAKELYDLFVPQVRWKLGQEDYKDKAKKCALISVDEIINTLNYDMRDLDVRGSVLLDLIDYWRNVKQEIEKLV